MQSDSPNRRYYHSKEGKWSGSFLFEITDRKKFSDCSINMFDRWRLISLSVLSQYFGPLTISTVVDNMSRSAQNEVVHLTRVSKWGITFFRSVEIIILDSDGISFTMTTDQRFWPTLWKSFFSKGYGTVAKDFDGATYHFPWIGSEILQTTKMVSDGLEIRQETAWSSARILLRHL